MDFIDLPQTLATFLTDFKKKMFRHDGVFQQPAKHEKGATF